MFALDVDRHTQGRFVFYWHRINLVSTLVYQRNAACHTHTRRGPKSPHSQKHYTGVIRVVSQTHLGELRSCRFEGTEQ